ncbi:hypothetical protein EJ03DRAFT_189908 [Teratosphaeria nubilosa]|uniref:Uncharacterized protein n=1 Tax=Teratosphaeria nubilosa TaxID=161662 RepID=A0A6G1LID6_9PEZI|nr:hypothetical protein EJ03DRAFT_189908 [Teratosphaeria nubilosa]
MTQGNYRQDFDITRGKSRAFARRSPGAVSIKAQDGAGGPRPGCAFEVSGGSRLPSRARHQALALSKQPSHRHCASPASHSSIVASNSAVPPAHPPHRLATPPTDAVTAPHSLTPSPAPLDAAARRITTAAIAAAAAACDRPASARGQPTDNVHTQGRDRLPAV